jgi:hypothetical protein
MPEHVEVLRRTRRELVEARERLDADIRDLDRILSRHGDEPPESQPVRPPGKASAPGEGRRETLELMSDGSVWSRSRLAKARGTSPNAAAAMLKRLEADGAIERAPGGFRLVSPKGGDANGSPPDPSGGVTERSLEEVNL